MPSGRYSVTTRRRSVSWKPIPCVWTSVSSFMSVLGALLPRAPLQAEVRKEDRSQQERNHHRRQRRAFAESPARDGALETQGGHQMRRIERSTARQHVYQLEVGEREQNRKGHH